MNIIEVRYTRRVSNDNHLAAKWLAKYEHEELTVLASAPEDTPGSLEHADQLRAAVNELLFEHPIPDHRLPGKDYEGGATPILGSTSESEVATKARTSLAALRSKNGLFKWFENVNKHPDLSSDEKDQLYHHGKARASDLLEEGKVSEEEHGQIEALIDLLLGKKEIPF